MCRENDRCWQCDLPTEGGVCTRVHPSIDWSKAQRLGNINVSPTLLSALKHGRRTYGS